MTNLLRPTGWDMKNGATIEHGNSYTYSPTDGRLGTVVRSTSTFKAMSPTPTPPARPRRQKPRGIVECLRCARTLSSKRTIVKIPPHAEASE